LPACIRRMAIEGGTPVRTEPVEAVARAFDPIGLQPTRSPDGAAGVSQKAEAIGTGISGGPETFIITARQGEPRHRS